MNLSQLDTTIYSEEVYPVSEQEFDEVMQMMAEDMNGSEGDGEWSQELEQGSIVDTPKGAILINKECTLHATRCSKGLHYQGIAI